MYPDGGVPSGDRGVVADGDWTALFHLMMVPENLLHPVPENLRLTEERSRQDDLGSNRGNDRDADADPDA
ncbi:MAG: hypothetical protein ACOY0T_03365, partial [Myxococcota bacterium]